MSLTHRDKQTYVIFCDELSFDHSTVIAIILCNVKMKQTVSIEEKVDLSFYDTQLSRLLMHMLLELNR